jgi:O-antigen ligase
VHAAIKKTPHYLWAFSFCGLAVFVPFSIAGANIAIGFGFVAALIAVFSDPEARERYRRIRHDPMLFACALLVLSALPSVFISDDLRRALRDLKSYWILLVYFLVAYNLVSDKLRRVVFWILFGSVTVSSLVALIQYGGGLELLFFSIAPQTYRPGSTLYNMTFAGILCQLITLNSAVALRYKQINPRALALAVGVIAQSAALFVTLTRGAWLALLAGLFAIPFLLKRRILLLVMACVVLFGGVVAFQNDTIRDRATTIVRSLRSPTDDNVATRLVLWDISWQVFKDHPVFGVGMGDYSIVAKEYLNDRKVLTVVDSHNIYLQLLATRGLAGFLPFVVFWILLFRVLFDARRSAVQNGTRFGEHYVTGTIAATIAVLIGALSENNIDDSEVFICFMFLVGIARSFRISPPWR